MMYIMFIWFLFFVCQSSSDPHVEKSTLFSKNTTVFSKNQTNDDAYRYVLWYSDTLLTNNITKILNFTLFRYDSVISTMKLVTVLDHNTFINCEENCTFFILLHDDTTQNDSKMTALHLRKMSNDNVGAFMTLKTMKTHNSVIQIEKERVIKSDVPQPFIHIQHVNSNHASIYESAIPLTLSNTSNSNSITIFIVFMVTITTCIVSCVSLFYLVSACVLPSIPYPSVAGQQLIDSLPKKRTKFYINE